MSMVGKERTIAFNPTEWYYAKNTCNLQPVIKLPAIVDDSGVANGDNNFIRRVLATYRKSQTETQSMTKQYDELLESIATAVEAASTADALNAILESLATTQVYNSKMVGEQRVARKAKALGLSYNQISKKYE